MKRSDRPQLFQHISMRVFSPHTVIHFSVSDGKVGGRQLCLGRFISLQICWYSHETEVKDFFVCSFGIAAHKKHACCRCAVLKGLYLWKTSVLLQGWCDLLLLLEWSELVGWEPGSQGRKEILELNLPSAALFGSQPFHLLLRSTRSFLKPSSTN